MIPAWNQAHLLDQLLQTIACQTKRPERVIVVDNASRDDTAEVARQFGAEVVRMDRNLGFAAAVNRGIVESHTDWVALLNTDVELAPDWLEHIEGAARTAGASYAAGKLYMFSDRDRIDGTWDLIACSGCATRAGFGERDGPPFESERRVALIPATAAIYRKDLFARVGPFAEVYESYLEDVDFSLRAACAGELGLYVPSATAWHHGQGSSGKWSARVTGLNARNQALIVRRLFPETLKRQFRRKIFVGQTLWGLVAACHGRALSWLTGRIRGNTCAVAVSPLDETALRALLIAQENEIRTMRRSGSALYWRLYFLATGPASE